MTVEKSFPLERVDVLHHRRLARETEMMLDLARAWRDAFLTLLELNEFQDAALSLREHVVCSSRNNGSSSSNEQLGYKGDN